MADGTGEAMDAPFSAEQLVFLLFLLISLTIFAAVSVSAARKVKTAADFTVGGFHSRATLVAGTIIGTIIESIDDRYRSAGVYGRSICLVVHVGGRAGAVGAGRLLCQATEDFWTSDYPGISCR